MQQLPDLSPGQLSFNIEAQSRGQSAWSTAPTVQGGSVSANVRSIGVPSNCAHRYCTTMNPIRGRYYMSSSYGSSQVTTKVRMEERRFGGETPDSFQDQDP